MLKLMILVERISLATDMISSSGILSSGATVVGSTLQDPILLGVHSLFMKDGQEERERVSPVPNHLAGIHVDTLRGRLYSIELLLLLRRA